jgi:hypothetical protein
MYTTHTHWQTKNLKRHGPSISVYFSPSQIAQTSPVWKCADQQNKVTVCWHVRMDLSSYDMHVSSSSYDMHASSSSYDMHADMCGWICALEADPHMSGLHTKRERERECVCVCVCVRESISAWNACSSLSLSLSHTHTHTPYAHKRASVPETRSAVRPLNKARNVVSARTSTRHHHCMLTGTDAHVSICAWNTRYCARTKSAFFFLQICVFVFASNRCTGRKIRPKARCKKIHKNTYTVFVGTSGVSAEQGGKKVHTV